MRFKWKRQSANTQHVQCITIKHYNFDRNQQCHKLWPAWAAFISIIPLSSFSSTLTRTHESMWQFGVAFVFSNAYHLFVLQQNVSSQPFFHNNILLENNKKQNVHVLALRKTAQSLSSRYCCPMRTLCWHRNVLMWLITLTWTHADISSYTDDLNKQCRRRAGWADKAEQTKALTASRIHTSYLHNLLYRELHDHPVALWVFEEDILQSPSFCRILST